MRTTHGLPRRAGFTLVELLVVITIVVLITAATLPVVLPALGNRQVDEGARILQSALASARDNAVRNNEPRGIRLVPDPSNNFAGGVAGSTLAYNRILAIEPAADYTEGIISRMVGPAMTIVPTDENHPDFATLAPAYVGYANYRAAVVEMRNVSAGGLPAAPTAWFWNIRQGDRIRFGNSGKYYTIAGPMRTANPERFINFDDPSGATPPYISLPLSGDQQREFLLLVDGDDNTSTDQPNSLTFQPNGFIDDGFDGLDNNNDGIVDPGFNGVDDAVPNGVAGVIDDPGEIQGNGTESENDDIVAPAGWGSANGFYPSFSTYAIARRPVVSERGAEFSLPANVLIDATTWDAPFHGYVPERSRLPIDPLTQYVDIMIAPNGQVVPSSPGQSSVGTPSSSMPFYHFWLTEREEVTGRIVPTGTPAYPTGLTFLLPMPDQAVDPDYNGNTVYKTSGGSSFLKRERRLVTLFARSGDVVTNSIQNFSAQPAPMTRTQAQNALIPYIDAQQGTRELP